MIRKIMGLVAATASVAMLFPAPAAARNCRPPCANVPAAVRGVSILPGPDDATLRGELFNGPITTLNVARNGSQQIKLNFGFQIGAQTFSSIFVNENGAVSFGQAISSNAGLATRGTAFQPVVKLSELGVPVIAPFYADLLSDPNQSRTYLRNVVVQFGTADPYANNGVYSPNDFQNAVKITWFGVINGSEAGGERPVFAQLLLAGDNHGTSSFSFNYGPPGQPGESGDGSIAGFSLGRDHYQFHGPYGSSSPTYFEFDDGRFVGSLANGDVPEPTTWLLMIMGFGLVGGVLRYRTTTARRARITLPRLAGTTG